MYERARKHARTLLLGSRDPAVGKTDARANICNCDICLRGYARAQRRIREEASETFSLSCPLRQMRDFSTFRASLHRHAEKQMTFIRMSRKFNRE